MTREAMRAWVLLPDLEAVAASERDVAGMPLLLRTVCSLRDAGVGRIAIVAPAGRPPRVPLDDPRVAAVVAPEAAVADRRAPAVLVLRGDLVYRRDLLRRLVGADAGTVVSRGVADRPGCVACVAPAAGAEALVAHAATLGLDVAVERRLADQAWLEPEPGAVLPVGSHAEVKRAEAELLRALLKPTDGFFSRHVNRRVSLWLTSLLMHTAVRPNHVSVVTLLLGVLAGVVAATGGWAAGAGGALLLEAQSILDGVDGELARLKHQRSRLGEWLDTVSDDLASLCFFIGLTVNVARSGVDWAVAIGGVAIGASLAGRVVVYWLLATVYHSGSQFAIEWDFTAAADARGVRRVGVWLMTVLRAAIKRDCFVKVFLLLALLGRVDVVLVLACAFAVGYLVKLAPQTQRLLRGRRAARPVRRAPSRLAPVTAV